MQHLMRQGIRSLIMTSGTLAPLKPVLSEMDIEAPFQLTNPHIVQKSQVFAKIMGRGASEVELNGSYENR